jgi:hypothetical protein
VPASPSAARDTSDAEPADVTAAVPAGAAAAEAARPGGADQAPDSPPSAPATQQDARAGANRTGDSNLSGSDLFGAGAQAPAGATAAGAQPPPGQWGRPATAEQANGTPGGQEPEAQAGAGPDGEPATEEHEPAEAALVATLEDEVVVIDEQPRYHVPGCRALTAHEPIPLPAREAVELGFTPCGWCRPNHTLAERHPAATR